MAQLVSSMKGKDELRVLSISQETALANGLIAEAINYEICRDAEKAMKEAKDVSGTRLVEGMLGWQAEYPDAAFDLLGTEDEGGKLVRLRVQQTAPRETLDRELVARRLMELGVSVETIEDALAAGTKRGEPGKAFIAVRRVKGVG